MALEVNQQLENSLKVDNKGWNIAIFDDKIKLSTCVCAHCNSVCCDAVELGCDHQDNEIFAYCNKCLTQLIEDNDGLCPINKHKNPSIVPSRLLRGQILRSMVICPYSIHYQEQNNKQNQNPNVIDTIGNDDDQKEGICRNKNCEWKGTLNDLLNTDHLKKCTLSNNPSMIYEEKIKDYEKKLQQKHDQIQQQIKKMTELKLKLDLANKIHPFFKTTPENI